MTVMRLSSPEAAGHHRHQTRPARVGLSSGRNRLALPSQAGPIPTDRFNRHASTWKYGPDGSEGFMVGHTGADGPPRPRLL